MPSPDEDDESGVDVKAVVFLDDGKTPIFVAAHEFEPREIFRSGRPADDRHVSRDFPSAQLDPDSRVGGELERVVPARER